MIGDFDSLGETPDHPNVIRSPAEKDDTDMMLAVKAGLEYGCKTFIIDGGLGGRLDQTYANIQILSYLAANDATGLLTGKNTCVTAVRNGTLSLGAKPSGVVSIFCAGDKATGVTLSGFKYPLNEAILTNVYPVGVSNEFTGDSATVTVKEGTLIIMMNDQ